MPVGGVRHAQTGAAEEHPTPRIVPLDASRHLVCEVRIIDRFRPRGAQVERLVPESTELVDQPRLELHAGMVRSDGNDFGHLGSNV